MAVLDDLKITLAQADPNSMAQIGGLSAPLSLSVSDLNSALGVTSTFQPPAIINVPPASGLSPSTDQAYYVSVARLNVRDQGAAAGNIINRFNQGATVHVNPSQAVQADGHTWMPLVNAPGWIAVDLIVPVNGMIAPNQRGVNVTAGGWAPTASQVALIKQNQVSFALICTYEPNQAVLSIQPLIAAGVKAFILRACIHELPTTPDRFAQINIPIMTEYINAIGSSAPILIAIGNEPNLKQEGWGSAWSDGASYANWWLALAARYRSAFPTALIGFPAMSPGGDVPNVRLSDSTFLSGCTAAIEAANWVGVHDYWQQPDGSDIAVPAAQWRSTFGTNKLIIGTEVGPTDSNKITAAAMNRAYTAFTAAGIPACAWLLGGSGAWQNAAWDLNMVTL